jgi:hypothetical protein
MSQCTNYTIRSNIDAESIVENYDVLALVIDEIVDQGVILETDPITVVQRVSKAPAEDVVQMDFSNQGVNQLAKIGQARFADWLRQGL